MIWEPFLLALVLGIVVSAGLYFAYLWPSVEPAPPAEPSVPADAPPGDRPAPSSGGAADRGQAPVVDDAMSAAP